MVKVFAPIFRLGHLSAWIGLNPLGVVAVAGPAIMEDGLSALPELLPPPADWVRRNWKARDGPARVLVCLAASGATRALKAAGLRLCVPVVALPGMEQ